MHHMPTYTRNWVICLESPSKNPKLVGENSNQEILRQRMWKGIAHWGITSRCPLAPLSWIGEKHNIKKHLKQTEHSNGWKGYYLKINLCYYQRCAKIPELSWCYITEVYYIIEATPSPDRPTLCLTLLHITPLLYGIYLKAIARNTNCKL